MAQRLAGATAFAGMSTAESRRRLPRVANRHAAVRLPRSLVSEMAGVKLAAARAADGDAGGAIATVERTLLQRATLGPRASDEARIASVGYERWLDEQLDWESLDDSELEEALHDALPSLGLSASQLYSRYSDNPFVPIFELWTAALYRAIYSPRQLFERMAIFWSDHFSIDLFADFQYLLKPVDDREVVRRHALGDFGDLLWASAHSPAMLIFLTNDTNTRVFPNENYARELMELHTMGADRGYTEKDVKEVARCFTGWTVTSPLSDASEPLTFAFAHRDHDTGKKRVLGRTIAAGGDESDGERVLKILRRRKETREFLATKLLRYLHGYEPTKTAVRKVAESYRKTDGDIREMVRTALARQRMRRATVKLKRPFHLVVSALRGLYADVQDGRFALGALREAGHIPFGWEPPDGYPDSAEYWSGFPLPRWNFGAELLTSSGRGVVLDPAVTESTNPADVVDRLDALLFGGRMNASTRSELLGFLRKGNLSRKRVRDAIGLAIAAPDFQEY